MTPATDWLLWQLADSAFPTGGFAHSAGLEAAWQLGLARRDTLGQFFAEALEHGAAGSLPLVRATHVDPDRFAVIDELADASLSNHVANRASRAQGAALVSTAASAFGIAALVELKVVTRRDQLPTHLAPAFGAVTRALGLSADEACRLFVFQILRTLVSSAVRLGAVGPLEAQAIQSRLASVAEDVVERHSRRNPDELAQTSPLIELFQGHHDRLYSRLFSS